MSFETRIIRQVIPGDCIQHGSGPIEGASMKGLVAPDSSGEWRYRDMQLMPVMISRQGYSASAGSYVVPGEYSVPPAECLVIWERYKETTV